MPSSQASAPPKLVSIPFVQLCPVSVSHPAARVAQMRHHYVLTCIPCKTSFPSALMFRCHLCWGLSEPLTLYSFGR